MERSVFSIELNDSKLMKRQWLEKTTRKHYFITYKSKKKNLLGNNLKKCVVHVSSLSYDSDLSIHRANLWVFITPKACSKTSSSTIILLFCMLYNFYVKILRWNLWCLTERYTRLHLLRFLLTCIFNLF